MSMWPTSQQTIFQLRTTAHLKMNSSQNYLCMGRRWLYLEINGKHMSGISPESNIVKHANTQNHNNSNTLNVVIVSNTSTHISTQEQISKYKTYS